MRRSLLLSFFAVLLAACGAPPATPANDVAESSDAAFADLSKRWLDGAMRMSPVTATQIGDHRFDSEIDDLSAEGRAKGLQFSKNTLAELGKIGRSRLSRENQVDAALLDNQLRYDIWNTETLQGWAWDPQIYGQLAGGALYTLMAREFAPMPDRLRAATARMEKIPALFVQMRANLDPARVPEIHAKTVAEQNPGIMGLVEGMILPHADELPAADMQRLQAAADALRKAAAEQQEWLDKTLLPNAKGDFRLGQKLYDEKLAFALLSPMTRQDIRQRAEAELARTRVGMYKIARQVLADKPNAGERPESPTPVQQQAAIRTALNLAAADAPSRDTVVDVAKAELAKATEFVRAKELITLPDAPVQVIPMPEFQRGVTVAYCDSPGPLDKHLATFYAVSPIPDDWTPKQVASFLREYNTRSIAELGVHEGMPGHYVQIWHSNKYPSTLRAVLSSGSFVEGWAVYAERMMAEQGFLDGDPLYRLVQMKWYLRGIANAMLDQAIQVDNMSEAEAMALMTEQTFQEEREAAGKWKRARLTSAQLPTYFVGLQEHVDLLHEVQQREGAKFDLRTYHDAVLAYGSPPVRFVRELMLDLPIQ